MLGEQSECFTPKLTLSPGREPASIMSGRVRLANRVLLLAPELIDWGTQHPHPTQSLFPCRGQMFPSIENLNGLLGPGGPKLALV